MHSPVEWPWRETHETRTHDNRSQYGLIRNQFCIRKIEGVLPSCLGFGSRPSRDLLISISTNNEQRKQRTIKQTMGGGKATKKQRRQGSPFSIHVIAEITWTCRGYLKVAQWHTMEMLHAWLWTTTSTNGDAMAYLQRISGQLQHCYGTCRHFQSTAANDLDLTCLPGTVTAQVR